MADEVNIQDSKINCIVFSEPNKKRNEYNDEPSHNNIMPLGIF